MQPAIAIIGTAFKFPGADDDAAFTEILINGGINGASLIRPPPPDRWPFYQFASPSELARSPRGIGGYIDGAFEFNPRIFSLSPREARLVDPQHRMVLEMALFAQEDAGYGGGALAETRTGVFIGSSRTDYLDVILNYLSPEDYMAGLANNRAVLSNRVSSVFNFTGPSMTIDSLCSSSFAAVHAAVRSLAAGDCDVALAGGVSFLMSPYFFFVLNRTTQLSPTNACRPFHSSADGFVPGEGGAIFCLKRLPDALAARDPIRAVIIGSSMVHHGHSTGLTVPDSGAMVQVMSSALIDAGREPAEIGLLQAMGASNRLGDRAELDALQKVFGAPGRAQPLPISCEKAVIGHLEAASGAAGLVSAIRALEEKKRFPLHGGGSDQAYPEVRGVRFVREAEDWPSDGLRRASVNSFGMTGAHVNLVVEEAPPLPSSTSAAEWHALPVSSDSADTLALQAAAYSAALSEMDQDLLADACFTAATGRRHGQFRAVVISSTRRGLLEGLNSLVIGASSPDPNTTVIRGNLGTPVYGFPRHRRPSVAAERRIDRTACEGLAQAFVNGETVAWEAIHPGQRRRARIPKSRIERQTLAFEPEAHRTPPANVGELVRTSTHPLLGGARRG
jgi:acyl transferase domain-containing protein